MVQYYYCTWISCIWDCNISTKSCCLGSSDGYRNTCRTRWYMNQRVVSLMIMLCQYLWMHTAHGHTCDWIWMHSIISSLVMCSKRSWIWALIPSNKCNNSCAVGLREGELCRHCLNSWDKGCWSPPNFWYIWSKYFSLRLTSDLPMISS